MAHILVIEDDELFGIYLEEILSEAGHTMILAKNGQEGLKRRQEGRFDLILTDIIMPEKDGIELLRDLRNMSPQPKIITMSGGGHGIFPGDVLPITKMLGADYTLTKPFTKNELLPVIDSLLAKS
uniref:Putative Response regulator receiver protein n=1 Tax=Magnetococcus massalia (strain MO-1) TaxID=451514 RepID=A0A1S7LHU7_MAGMO|nr:putative Response regulator receiver protein [Candidatus Magnetococcus massalia]